MKRFSLSLKRKRMKYVLVCGLGGGSDAQVACALSQLESSMLKEPHTIIYMTCKWSTKDGTDNKELGITRFMYSLEKKEYSAEYVNAVVEGKPRWVGTTMMESTMPQVDHSYRRMDGGNARYSSPVIFELPKPKKDGEVGYGEDFVMEALEAICPETGFDRIIGVDSGGDVIGGLEDARDLCMLMFLRSFVDCQKKRLGKRPEFLLYIFGLCVDGENYFLQMDRKMSELVESGAYLDKLDIGHVRPFLEPMLGIMKRNKTPWIILDAIDSKLETVPNDQQIHDFEIHQETLHEVTKTVHLVKHFLHTKDSLGDNVEEFVKIPERHHKLKDGSPVPAVFVPRNWVTHCYRFDADKTLNTIFSL